MNSGYTGKKLAVALAGMVLASGTLFADYVDFTGLTSAGGYFDNGGTIIGTTVSPISGTGVNSPSPGSGTQSANGSDSELFRYQQQSGYTGGSTLITTFTFDSVNVFSIQAFTLNSNMSSPYDTITFQANGESAGFVWNYTGLANGTTTYTSGDTISFKASGAGTNFLAFNLTPGQALSGFTVTLTSAAGASPFNSAQFKVDVIPEPTAAASIFAAGLAFTLIRFRKRHTAIRA